MSLIQPLCFRVFFIWQYLFSCIYCFQAAYSFYNVSTKTPWVDLMADALILAKKDDYDVFNALDLMENRSFSQILMLLNITS